MLIQWNQSNSIAKLLYLMLIQWNQSNSIAKLLYLMLIQWNQSNYIAKLLHLMLIQWNQSNSIAKLLYLMLIQWNQSNSIAKLLYLMLIWDCKFRFTESIQIKFSSKKSSLKNKICFQGCDSIFLEKLVPIKMGIINVIKIFF